MSMPKKTYGEWTIENPNFFTSLLEAGLIDEATVSSIEEWFTFRTLCDDEKFNTYFGRQLNLALPRYNKLVRIENTEFDALVNMYRERQVVDTGAETGSETIDRGVTNSETGSAGKNSTRTPNITTTDNGTASSTSDTDTSNTSSGTNSSSGTTNNMSLAKQAPQSQSYGSGDMGTDGMPNSLNWLYPSSQAQQKGTSGNSGTNSNTSTGSSDTSQSSTSENTSHVTGTETYSETDTNTNSGTIDEDVSKETEKTLSNTKREQWTGRDQLTPQEALSSAMEYIKNSSAFVWLKEQLEVCFISVYDV